MTKHETGQRIERLGAVSNAYSSFLSVIAADGLDALAWQGSDSDDFERANAAADSRAASCELSLGAGRAVVVEIGGCGRSDVYRAGDALVCVEHYSDNWDDDIEADFLRTVAEHPTSNKRQRLGSVEVRSGVLALVSVVEPVAALTGGQISELARTGGVAQHPYGLLVAVPAGSYEVWVEQLGDVTGEWGLIEGRVRVVPAGTPVVSGAPIHTLAATAAPAPAAEQPERRQLFVPAWDAVGSLAISPDGRFVVAGEKGGARCCCWSAEGALLWQTALLPRATSGRYSQYVRVGFDHAATRVLALVPYHDTLFALDMQSGKVRRRALRRKRARAIACAPDGKSFVLRAGTGAHLLDDRLKPLVELEGYCNRDQIAQTADGRLIAVHGSAVHVYERSSGRTRTIEHDRGPRALAFSADGKALAIGYDDGGVRFYDTQTFAQRRCLDVAPERVRKPGLTSIAFQPQGRLFAVAGDDGTARVFDADSLAPVAIYPKHETAIPDTGARSLSQVAFSASGRWLFVSATLRKQPTGVTAYAVKTDG